MKITRLYTKVVTGYRNFISWVLMVLSILFLIYNLVNGILLLISPTLDNTQIRNGNIFNAVINFLWVLLLFIVVALLHGLNSWRKKVSSERVIKATVIFTVMSLVRQLVWQRATQALFAMIVYQCARYFDFTVFAEEYAVIVFILAVINFIILVSGILVLLIKALCGIARAIISLFKTG